MAKLSCKVGGWASVRVQQLVTCAVFGDLGPWRWGEMGIWWAKGPGTDRSPQSLVMYAGSGHVVSYTPCPWIKRL